MEEKPFRGFTEFFSSVIKCFLWKFILGGAGINCLLNVCNGLLDNKICSDRDYFIC